MLSAKISIERFFSSPIIYPNMDDRMGSNINGPAIIRMPNWCKDKLGTYHLYFSDHKGKYIRLAFADEIVESIRQAGMVPGVEHVEVVPVFDPPISMEMVPEETRMMMGW